MFVKLDNLTVELLKVSRVRVAFASKQAQSYVPAERFLILLYSLKSEQNLERLLQVIISNKSRDRTTESIAFGEQTKDFTKKHML